MQKANQVFGQLCYLLGGCQTVSENESLFTQKKMFELSELKGSVGSPPMCQQLINDFFGQVCIVQPSGRYSLVATLIEGVNNFILENNFKV